ncbi:MAG: hypothetical protein ACT4OK_11140 [Gemmobacter sp.]
MSTISDLFAKNPASTAGTGTQSGRINPRTGKPYDKAKVWLNFGINIEVPNADGELVPRFISLPMGLALDNMDPIETKPSDTPEWVEEVRMRNMLLSALKAETRADKLAPGQTAMLNLPIVAQARRVPEAAAETPVGESPALTALAKMLGMAA